jgi:hypothetical protein
MQQGGPSFSRREAVGALLAGATLPELSAVAAGAHKRIDATDFGVLADGTTDNAPALLRAIGALAPGAVLALPAGNIGVGSPGWSGLLLQGLEAVRIEGNGARLKWLSPPSLELPGFGTAGLKLKDCRGVQLADFSIDGNGFECMGIGLEGCSSCVMTKLQAFAHGRANPPSGSGQFVSVKGSANLWHQCVARDATPGSVVRGFYLGSANAGRGETDLRIEGCVASGNTATGFALEAVRLLCHGCVSENNRGAGFTSSTAKGSPSSDHVFQGNTSRGNLFHGWQTDVWGPNASRIVLQGNILCDNVHTGIYCHKGDDIAIVGNLISGNGRDTAEAGIAISMSNRLIISENIVQGDENHGLCIGLTHPANQINGLTVSNNQLRGSRAKTLSIEAGEGSALHGIVLSGNLIQGGTHGICLNAAPGAVCTGINVHDNVVSGATEAAYWFAERLLQPLGRLRAAGNLERESEAAGFKDSEAGNRSVGELTRALGPPATGSFERGSIIFNAAPAQGSPLGWVCVAGGSPGRWHVFGSVGTPG